MLLACALAVLALAGPAWKQVAQPAWQSRTPLVIALDLSSATLANDLPPSRLLQARAKIATLLRERAGGQVGLIAFADDAYTVAPLTDDAANVALFLDALAPDVMPVDGHRAGSRDRRAASCCSQAGFDRGDILLLTDHGDAAANAAAAAGGEAGHARLRARAWARAAGHRACSNRAAASRACALDAGVAACARVRGRRALRGAVAATMPTCARSACCTPHAADAISTQGRAGRSWEDAGYWLIPPLMLLALFAFRRGAGVAAMVLRVVAADGVVADGAHAQPTAPPKARCGDAPTRSPRSAWKPARRPIARGDFAGAASAYDGVPGADAQYNLGNALAKQGRYEEAIAAYDARVARATRHAGRDRQQPRRRSRDEAQAAAGAGPAQRSARAGQAGRQDAVKPTAVATAATAETGAGTAQPSQRRPAADSNRSHRNSDSPQVQSQAKPTSPPTRRRSAPPMPRNASACSARCEKQRQGRRHAASRPGAARAETPAERERRLANEAWLRRVPDDPGGLLRAKFRLEYERRQLEGGE